MVVAALIRAEIIFWSLCIYGQFPNTEEFSIDENWKNLNFYRKFFFISGKFFSFMVNFFLNSEKNWYLVKLLQV